MADMRLVAALKRFCTLEEVEATYKAATDAYVERNTEVVITSATFEGGGSSGQLTGDPAMVLDACEYVLAEKEAEEANTVLPAGPNHLDFSRRTVGT